MKETNPKTSSTMKDAAFSAFSGVGKVYNVDLSYSFTK